MSRKCIVERNDKRIAAVARDAKKRAELKKKISDDTVSFAEKMEARDALNKMDRNGSKTRLRNRCSLTGRGNGVFRKVGICRNKFREMASKGELPGVVKSSW